MPRPRSRAAFSTASALLAAALAAGVPQASLAAGETGLQRAREAASALQRNHADRAVALYTEALGDAGLPNERRAAIHNDRGVAYSRLNQVRAAIDDFNKAVQLFPENASVYNNRGNVLLAAGLTQEAVKDFDRAIVLAPGYGAAYSNRAGALASLGDSDGAVRDFSSAARLMPQSPAPLAGRARLLWAAGRPYAAVRDLDRALRLDQRFTPGYRSRADVKLALKRFDEAVEDLSRAVAFDPANFDIYLLRGYAYLATRNVQAAMRDFKRATELDPRSATASAALALAHESADAHDDALNELSRALEIDPRSALAYAYRAIVYKRMNSADLGQKDLERAIRLDASLPETAWARGELADAAGQIEEAVADLRKALAAKPYLRLALATLEAAGQAEAEQVEVRELTFDLWRVFAQQGRYYALHPDIGTTPVPLETAGGAQPRILEWDVRKPPHKGIGVLRFAAGQEPVNGKPEEAEYAVVVDIAARTVIAVAPVRVGERRAAWTWEDAKLIVGAVDGSGADEYPLKPQKDVAQAADRRRSYDQDRERPRYGDAGPEWAPWSAKSSGGGDGRRRQQQPKTLFDMLFKY